MTVDITKLADAESQFDLGIACERSKRRAWLLDQLAECERQQAAATAKQATIWRELAQHQEWLARQTADGKPLLPEITQ